jgi:hypothetical protein
MMMIRVLLSVGAVGLGGCTGNGAGPVTPPVNAVSVDRTADDLDMPNGLPVTTRPGTTVGVETDVVGVTHLPP